MRSFLTCQLVIIKVHVIDFVNEYYVIKNVKEAKIINCVVLSWEELNSVTSVDLHDFILNFKHDTFTNDP